MVIIILVSGCGIPSLERSASCILIQIVNEPLLFDSVAGTLVRLLKVDINYKNLKNVFYTHPHSDHIADLIPLIQALWTTPDYKRNESLNLYGPADFLDFMQTLAMSFGAWVTEPEFPLNIKALNEDKLQFENYNIECCPMEHFIPAVAYRIENNAGRSIVYSGDTNFNNEIIKLAQQADILILECSFPEKRQILGHLNPKDAAKIAAQANCKHLILTHIYPPYEEIEEEICRVIPKIYSGQFSIAHDFMKISL